MVRLTVPNAVNLCSDLEDKLLRVVVQVEDKVTHAVARVLGTQQIATVFFSFFDPDFVRLVQSEVANLNKYGGASGPTKLHYGPASATYLVVSGKVEWNWLPAHGCCILRFIAVSQVFHLEPSWW